ncbi:MAG: hypothetical protein ACSHXF_13805 [Aquaticitalea sp.]
MKNILLVLFLACVGFVSCDGRKSRSESLKASVAEFNEKQSEIPEVNYYPNEYTEVVTDTIISNGINVHIKNYSLLDKSILMSATENGQKEHRVFESEVVISTATKEILNTRISVEMFKSESSDSFWNSATLQHVWVNQELSSSMDVKLDMTFINPTNDTYKLYRLSIDDNGQQQMELIEERT